MFTCGFSLKTNIQDRLVGHHLRHKASEISWQDGRGQSTVALKDFEAGEVLRTSWRGILATSQWDFWQASGIYATHSIFLGGIASNTKPGRDTTLCRMVFGVQENYCQTLAPAHHGCHGAVNHLQKMVARNTTSKAITI